MPGMKKAALRRKRLASYITEVDLPTPFFNGDIVGTAWGSTKSGDPLLLFGLGCDAATIAEYVDELKGATLHVIFHENYVALAASRDGKSIGRLTTSLGSHLVAVVSELERRKGTKLYLGVVGLDEVGIPPFACPVVIQEGVVDDWDTIVVGTGEYVCGCFNVHTGIGYAHCFATEEAAREQRSRNEAEDRPFVGLQTN